MFKALMKTIAVIEETWKDIKIGAMDEGITMGEYVTRAVDNYKM